jgi:hypothetical protein
VNTARALPLDGGEARRFPAMNEPPKNKRSYFLVFLLGVLTPISYSAARALANHWPQIKAAIAKLWE